MNYNYFLPCFVSAAAILAAGGALAQQCVQAPSCIELGYTDSVSDCADDGVLYCPFDKTKVFCREINATSETPDTGGTDCSMYTQTPWVKNDSNATQLCSNLGRVISERKVTCNGVEYLRCALKLCGAYTVMSLVTEAAETCCSGLSGSVDIVQTNVAWFVYCT